MSDRLQIEIDVTTLLAALERFPSILAPRLKAGGKVTAEAIKVESMRRIARRQGGPTRNRHTAEGHTVEETRNGDGWVVYVASPDAPGVPRFLEFGTEKMTAREFLFPAAAMHEGFHDRLMREIVVETIAAEGLGD